MNMCIVIYFNCFSSWGDCKIVAFLTELNPRINTSKINVKRTKAFSSPSVFVKFPLEVALWYQ